MASSSVVIIDSGGANIASVSAALERLEISSLFTKNATDIENADFVILPGVGAAKHAMSYLEEHDLIEVIRNLTQPTLGICLGMQLLFSSSAEGDVRTLGIIDGHLSRFPDKPGLAVPHMGWNSVDARAAHPLLNNLPEDPYFYFVHSYFAPVTPDTIGLCHYETDFTAMMAKDNFMGCQFHPEKSGENGQQILKNFLNITL